MSDALNLIPQPLRAVHPINRSAPSQPLAVPPLRQAQIDWNSFFLAQQSNSSRIRDGHRPIQLSVENQRTNSPWGDPLEAKSEATTRIYALNLNGLTLDRRGGQFDDLCKVAKEAQADIVACQEHCLDTTQSVVRSILYDTIRQSWTRTRLTLGTTPTPFVNMYKPGGTMLFAVEHITGRVISSSTDKWGRWSTQTFRCQQGRKLIVVSAYQVNPDTKKKGVVTAAVQQRTLLLESQDPTSDPRSAFVRDFHLYLSQCITIGDDVMILGDFNEEVGRDRTPLTSLFSELGLVNLMKARHLGPVPPTYARGRKRLDYGFSTPRVALALKSCGYEAFNARFPTDHRSYYFDFDTESLFGTATPSLARPAQRILSSKNVKQVTAYLKHVYDYLIQCNAFERAKQLSHPGNRHAFAERLGQDMLQASLMAERKIQRVGEAAWSVALDQGRKKVTILKKCLSMLRTGLDCTSIINDSNQKLQAPLEIPTTKQQCCTMLSQAKREVNAIVSTSLQRRDQEMRERIIALENSGRKSDAANAIALRRLQRAEEIRRLFNKLRALRLKGQRQGVTTIEIPVHPDQDPKTCTEWRLINVPTEIVEHIQQRNKAHFGQAHGSPFTTPPLLDDLGFCGDGPGATEILHGRYDHTLFSDHVKLLLKHLQLRRK